MDSHNEGYDAGVIAGLKEALEIVYTFTGKKNGAHQGSGIGPAWDAIRSRIAELEKGDANG